MWSQNCSSAICLRKQQTQDRLKHMQNLHQAKHIIDTTTPFHPTYRISHFLNKSTRQKDVKVEYENSLLLRKMMMIQMNGVKINHETTPYQLVEQSTKKKQYDFKIMEENQMMIRKLQSANSNYGKKMWLNDSLRSEQIKINKARKMHGNDDYNLMAMDLLNKKSRSTTADRYTSKTSRRDDRDQTREIYYTEK